MALLCLMAVSGLLLAKAHLPRPKPGAAKLKIELVQSNRMSGIYLFKLTKTSPWTCFYVGSNNGEPDHETLFLDEGVWHSPLEGKLVCGTNTGRATYEIKEGTEPVLITARAPCSGRPWKIGVMVWETADSTPGSPTVWLEEIWSGPAPPCI